MINAKEARELVEQSDTVLKNRLEHIDTWIRSEASLGKREVLLKDYLYHSDWMKVEKRPYHDPEFTPVQRLIKVELETGRTHQIRVHFSALNHPLVGDTTYGADPVLAKSLQMARPWLHAKELRFTHPITEEQMEFKAEYPDDLQACLALLSDAVIP